MTARAMAGFIESLPRVGIFERDGRRTVFMLERAAGTWALTAMGPAVGSRMADAIPFDHLPNRAEIGDVPAWSRLYKTPIDEAGHEFRMCIETARGWPLLALRETRILDPMDPKPERVTGGIIIHRWGPTIMDAQLLPLIPIWRGLIINCLIYGGAWYAILFGVPDLLRWRKRKIRRIRGQCPACGYDLKGEFEAGCPECGWGRPT